jgi:Divergent InlB B-repeat domain
MLSTGVAVGVFPTTGHVPRSEAADARPLTMTWTDNSNGAATTVLERRLDPNNEFLVIAYVLPGVTTYVDATVSQGATYCYRAHALAANQVSDYSNEACASATSGGDSIVAVVKTGAGFGTVSSSPDGVGCGSTCSATFAPETPVVLTAWPEPGSRFAGWSGVCSGDVPFCMITVTGTVVAVAEFAEEPEGTCAATVSIWNWTWCTGGSIRPNFTGAFTDR